MTPAFSDQELSEHDLLMELRSSMKSVKDSVARIEKGLTPNCIIHTERLRVHWINIVALWGVVGSVAGVILYAWITRMI